MQSSVNESSERAVLISLGLAYTGVTGQADNHHSVFMLPSEGAKNNTKLVKIPQQYGQLLLWSAETNSNKLTNQESEDCVDEEGSRLSELTELQEINESLFESGD